MASSGPSFQVPVQLKHGAIGELGPFGAEIVEDIIYGEDGQADPCIELIRASEGSQEENTRCVE